MKIVLAITSDTGDTLVKKLEIPIPTGYKFTKFFVANKIMNELAGEIVEMVRILQEVDEDDAE